MGKWLSDQWAQIRGHVKYDVLKSVFIAVIAGSGIVAAFGTMSRRAFRGINADWFIFGAIFCCSVLVFGIALFRTSRKQEPPAKNASSNQLDIDHLSETLKLGALWAVPTKIYLGLSVELHEVRNENEVVIELASSSIRYAGARVETLQNNLNAGKYVLRRAAVDYGNDCVSHWDISESSFRGFYVYLVHANKFAKEATIGVAAIDAFQRSTSAPQSGAE